MSDNQDCGKKMSGNDDLCNAVNKPTIEKRRRERMNSSIKALRGLIGDTITRNTSPLTRVDKADILELTVKHIQQQQQQQQQQHHYQQHQTTAAIATQRSAFDAGFHECSKEVIHLLSTRHLTDRSTLQTLSNHLNDARMVKTAQCIPVPYMTPVSAPPLGICSQATATLSSPAAIIGVLSARNRSAYDNLYLGHPYMSHYRRPLHGGKHVQQNMPFSSMNSSKSSASSARYSPSREEISGESSNSDDIRLDQENDRAEEDKENNGRHDDNIPAGEDDNDRQEVNEELNDGARENVNISAVWRPW